MTDTAVTYSLGSTAPEVAQYYRTATALAGEVLSESQSATRLAVEGIRAYVEATGIEPARAREEYLIELLTLGVLWRIYSDEAHDLPPIPRHLLTRLAELRQCDCPLKPGIDFLRGVLGTLFLTPNEYDPDDMVDPSLEHLDRLIEWLAATGEFIQEVARLGVWRRFLAFLPDEEATDHLATAITFASWFEGRSEEVLGRYTRNVEQYLAEEWRTRCWREDLISCGRLRVEYHLNMVCAEIMNRVFREEFRATTRRILLLPACMRRRPPEQCGAKETPAGLICAGCDPGCQAHHLTREGAERGFSVILVSHQSRVMSGDSARDLLGGSVGVVGVTCVPNLLAGGWKARALGIPVQCVLLNYSGCKQHWHPEGIPTRISVPRLHEILGCAM